MTDRQQQIAHKRAIQFAKNTLKQIKGIQVIQLFEQKTPQSLDELYHLYIQEYSYDTLLEPCSKLYYQSSPEEICFWIIDTLKIAPHTKYFINYGVWTEIEILDVKTAIQSLWSNFSAGLFLIKTDLSAIWEIGLDSRDEYHYLIDIWKNPKMIQ